MTIAILITVHNRKQTTLSCLEKLFKNTLFNKQKIIVYLVDDGSTDGTDAAVSENFPDVKILKGDGNLFWNRGMLHAWESASTGNYDFYIWLNDDTELYENALEALLNTYTTIPQKKAIVVGSVCDTVLGNKTTYGGRIKKRIISPQDNIKKVETFNGNLVLIPKQVFLELGYNDSKFRHSFGDIEYGYRATKKGVPIYITDSYVATCDRHDQTMKCFNNSFSIKQRLKHFYSPLGMNPFEFFYLNRKYKGITTASLVFITTHLRVFFPSLWDIRKKTLTT